MVEVLRERGREIFRQIKAPDRRNTGSIPRFGTPSRRRAELLQGTCKVRCCGNAELAEKIRSRAV